MRSDWLDAFLAFSEHLNFTHAAEELHISQPALHVKIQKLSRQLGTPLYHRDGRHLHLTPEGVRLAAFARDQRDRVAAFTDSLSEGAKHQPVVLCAGEGAYLHLLGPALSAFLGESGHRLRLLTGDQERTFTLLQSGQAHLGVSAPDTLPEGIEGELLTEVDQVLLIPKNHRLASHSDVTLNDLEGEALIVPPRTRPHRIMLNRMLMDAGVNWQVAVEAGGWELMQHFVRLGIGLAVVNGFCRPAKGLIAKQLAALPRIHYQLLERSDSDATDGARALKQYLLQHGDAWRSIRNHNASSA